MYSITESDVNTSPFDQIKQIDEKKNEYWLATDLLKLMKYQTWKSIKETVGRARLMRPTR